MTVRQGACVLVRASDTGRVLFLQSPSGMWEIPGGGRERGETGTETALTELWEETGLVYPENELGWVREIKPPGREYLIFSARVPAEFEPRLSEEHTAYLWAFSWQPPRPIHQSLYELLVPEDQRSAS